jgi:hypothetical protein
MTVYSTPIRTAMSCFAVALAIAACTSEGPPTTSLAGAVSCGAQSCGSGQLCYTQYSGAPDGGVSYECDTVASGCAVFDCEGAACPKCIVEVCTFYPELVDLFNVVGRTVTCQGE